MRVNDPTKLLLAGMLIGAIVQTVLIMVIFGEW